MFFPVKDRRTFLSGSASFLSGYGELLRANAIAAHLATSGLTALDVEAWTQAQRDAVAKRAGQRSPSEKTWALVLSKLERRMAA